VVPQPVTELRLSQQGDRLLTSFVAPRTASDGSRLGVLEIELLHTSREGDFEKLAQRTTQRVAPGEAIVREEPLPAPGTVVRVAARAVVKGRPSNRSGVVTLVSQPPPLAPQALTLELAPTGLILRWTDPNPPPPPAPTPEPTPAPTPEPSPATIPAPVPSASGSTAPASPAAAPPGPSPTAKATPTPAPPVRGFWVYRRPKDGAYARPLDETVLTASHYEDRSVQPGEEWCYVVRFLASKEPLVESDSASEVCAGFKDIAAPAAPIGVAVMLRADGVEISWSPSPEADLVGYRVYRMAPPGEPPMRIAEVPVPQTSVKDDSARTGVVNVYTVAAFDKAGNESRASSPVQVRP
jgi:hypothetical protein